MGGLVFYSYSQINVSLDEVSYHSIDWTEFTFLTLIKLGLDILVGDWLAAAFDLIEGINLNLFFEITNNGLLPVYIPDLSYDLSVNGEFVGKGITSIEKTIFPGQSINVKAFQNFQKSGLEPAISSIISNDGMMEIQISGTAHLKFFGLDLPIPFESSKKVSVYDEIRKKLSEEVLVN